MAKKGTITFKDAEANFRTMRVKAEGTKLLADVNILATALMAYTDCDVRATGLIDKSYSSVSGGGNADRKGVVTVADVDGEVHKWSLSGYSGATAVDKEGEHMVDPDLQIIVDAIAAFSGESYTVLRSPVIQTR